MVAQLTINRSTFSIGVLLLLVAVSSPNDVISTANAATTANLRSGTSRSQKQQQQQRKYHFSTHTHSEANRYIHELRMKQQEELKRQRKLQPNSSSSTTTSNITPYLADTPDDNEWVFVMVECQNTEDWRSCVNRIQSVGTSDSLTVMRYLSSQHMCAVKTKYINIQGMGHTEEDPVRQPFHLPESLEIIDDITSIREGEAINSGDLNNGRKRDRNLQLTDQAMPYGIDLVRAPDVWEQFGTQGEGVKICVLDSGVSYPHPDLDNIVGYEGEELVQPWFEDDVSGHGTHVTGIASASDNGVGVVGVAPGAEVIFGRVFDDDGLFHSSDIIAGLEACRDSGAQIVNLSLGGPGMARREQIVLESFFDTDRIVTVAAVGNTGEFELSFPAAYDYVLGVAAVDRDRNRADFSTRNTKIDVAAPGVRVASTYPDGRYAFLSGTSMASPHVAGVVALMLSVNPDATPIDIFLALRETAINDGSPDGPDTLLGFGIVDALGAVENISGTQSSPANPTPAPTQAATPAPTPSLPDGVFLPGDGDNGSQISAQYVVTMEHFTDQFTGVSNQPGGYPLVRYMCRGDFDVIASSRAIRENTQNIACTEVTDDEGFSGWECLHQCDASNGGCRYWWNNDAAAVAEGWANAGVWFECRGNSEADTQAKFEWLDNGGFDLSVPPGTRATNGKVARLAVRTDYTETDEELLDRGVFPPIDVTADHITVGDDVNFRSNMAPDGGYYGWTGVSGCEGSCPVRYSDLDFQSNPSTFPEAFFKEVRPASAPSQSPLNPPIPDVGSDFGDGTSSEDEPISNSDGNPLSDSNSSGVSSSQIHCAQILLSSLLVVSTTLFFIQ